MRSPRGFSSILTILGIVLVVSGLTWWFLGARATHSHIVLPQSAPIVQSATTSSTVSSASTHTYVPAATPSSTLDLSAIPLGDGKVSTAPKAGYVYSCQTTFAGGGADHAGNWIHGSTWDLYQKTSVAGKVYWPNAVFTNVIQGAYRVITGNGLPVNEPTGIFPIAQSDPAYQYDHNPNSIKAQQISYTLPANPIMAATASCVPMGPVGIALDGVAIYNALDDAGRDAVAHETQDSCNGHPQSAGQYHYHGPSPCMPNVNARNTVVGYALDGFPITSLYNAKGQLYTNSELDACHGITGTYIDAQGATKTGYHYVLTQEYPYTVGCFRGTPVHGALPSGGAHTAPNVRNTTTSASGSGGTPPQAAIDACTGKAPNASCTVTGHAGTCRTTPDGSFACIPG